VGEHGKWDKKSVNKKINNYQNKHSKTEWIYKSKFNNENHQFLYLYNFY
jgi:hypothetical protein